MEGRAESYGARGEKRLDRLLAALRRRQVEPYLPEQGVVVDLGCGYRGALLAALAPRLREGIGLDLSVQPDPPAPNVRLLPLPAGGELPLADESADLVTCLAVIEHVEQPERLLAEARRILRRDGVLVLTTPSAQAVPVLRLLALARLIDPVEIDDHKRAYSPASLRHELEGAGFRIVGLRRFEARLNLAAVATPSAGRAAAREAP